LLVISAVFVSASVVPSAIAAGEPQSATVQPSTTSHHRARSSKKPAAAEPAAKAAAQPAAPPAPKPPNWPANDPPASASVVWDSHGLTVTASNSSLAQILKEVSVDTGVKIEGFSSDERIFGTYGPGPAQDVLSQFLDGSNYDVLIVGEQGQGTPRRVVLTLRSSTAPANNSVNPPAPAEDDTGSEEQSEQPPNEQAPLPPPQAAPNPSAPDVPVRTQQQIIQEMQERERQLEQQRQQQNPPQ
jgi:hypothetical protein